MNLLLAMVAAMAQQPGPKLCDLDTLYISRTPRYPGYLPIYGVSGKEGQPILTKPGSSIPMSPEEAAAVQHWPRPGEMVTYTAVVENKGTGDASAFEYEWQVDGKPVSVGKTETVLRFGERIEVIMKWPWKQEFHDVKFWADPMRRIRQFSYANDSRTVSTMAKTLVCYADLVTYASFAKNRNFLGTYSFEDWCQAHADWMNHLYALSIYPGTVPNGILDRVTVDFIGVLADDKAHEARWSKGPPLSEGWDGAWWFGRNPDCAEWASGMDWGLIHEWGHQMGLTDLYVLDVAPESNHVLDRNGLPLLIGHMSSGQGSIMHGHGPVIFSEDQAIALNHQRMRRRGYYGDYYYNLADKYTVLVTDLVGKPVSGANLDFWQREEHGPGFSGAATFSGETDAGGRFALPNRPAPPVATYGDRGYQQKPNPFGAINVVGGNGVFLVRVQARGQTDYAFLDIPQFNVAAAKQSPILALRTQLPVQGAAAAPSSPVAEQDGTRVRLTMPGIQDWIAFRADPNDYIWKQIGESRAGVVEDTLPGTGLYRYSAAFKTNGVLSARSEPLGVAAMTDPWGLAVAPDGSAWVRDRANGQSLLVRPNGSAVGFLGSVHWHLEGSYDHATDPDGNLYVAQWPHGYDPTHTRIRRVAPLPKSEEHDHTDFLEAEWKSGEPGHLKEPMGVWVGKDGTIVVADTGNNRVQTLAPGAAPRVVSGLNRPHKAMLVNGQLVVCDTGAKRVVVFDTEGTQVAEILGFEEPIYLCAGPADDVWIADRKLGRVFAVSTVNWKKLDWSYPPMSQPGLKDLRGIGYDPTLGDMLYIDGAAKRLVRRKVLD